MLPNLKMVKGPQVRKSGWPLEAGRGKGIESPPKVSRSPADMLILSQGTPF